MKRLNFLFLILLFSVLQGNNIKGVKNGITSTKIGNNLYKIKIFLNHENSSLNQIKLFGSSSAFTTNIPIANRWKIESAKLYLKYNPSIALETERSFLSVSLNKKVIRQYKLLNSKFMNLGDSIINIPLPIDNLERFNEFSIQVFQHYLLNGIENMSNAPEVWTEISLNKSYIEFIVKKKKIKESLSSILKYIFDNGNPLISNINYPLPNLTNETLYNYSFISSSIGNILKYRDVSFSVTDKLIDNSKDNLIIGTNKEVLEILKINDLIYLDPIKNISIFANPNNETNAIIIIRGKNNKEVKRAIFSTTLFELNLNDTYSKNILKVEIPKKAEKYSSPNFIPTDKKIFFKDLNYKTKTFKGYYSEPLNIDFKLYPDLFFPKKSNVEFSLDLVLPNSVKDDSILNTFINQKYVTQKKVIEENENRSLKEFLFLDPNYNDKFPTEFLKDGKNRLTFQFKLIPFKDARYTIHNTDTLQATISDNSYFKLPKAKRWIKMADIRYFISSAYPYSIYPDLQDTALILTDNKQESVEALMDISFFLGKSIKYPSYYLSVGTSLNNNLKDKNLIIIGGYNKDFQKIFNKASLKITKDNFEKEVILNKKFFNELELIENQQNQDKITERKQIIKSLEKNNGTNYLITQFFQSPYNSNKTILLFYGNGINFKKEILSILMPKYNADLSGNLIISKLVGKEKELISLNFNKNKYFIGNLDLIDKSKFYISLNPTVFTITVFLSIIILVYLLRKSLLLYKARYHNDAD